MRTTYEEKTYENYFNTELAGKSDIYFPIGQVQEGNFGFDAASFSRHNRLWRKFGHRFPFWRFWDYPFHGAELRHIADEMEDLLNRELNHLPNMKVNLLFQYKKPEYILTAQGREWKHWNKPYFRYSIYQEQQKLLMHIHDNFSQDVLVLYASPAIKDINELVERHKQRKIIDFSNFSKAKDLDGHHKNTYVEAGTYSIACSEPREIERINLLQTLERIDYNNKNDGNSQFIVNFKNKIVSTISEDINYSEAFASLNRNLEEISNYKLFHSFLSLSNFRQITGIQWLIGL